MAATPRGSSSDQSPELRLGLQRPRLPAIWSIATGERVTVRAYRTRLAFLLLKEIR